MANWINSNTKKPDIDKEVLVFIPKGISALHLWEERKIVCKRVRGNTKYWQSVYNQNVVYPFDGTHWLEIDMSL